MSVVPDPAGPVLRLFVGEAGPSPLSPSTPGGNGTATGPPALSPALTLREFFEQYVLPVYLRGRRAAESTVGQWRESVRLWAAYTGGPPLGAIDDYVCAEFVAGLSARKWRGTILSPNTVRKHVVPIAKILSLAGPRTQREPAGKGLLAEVPYLPKPPERVEPSERDLSLAEIEQWMAACDGATRPRIAGVEPADWWRALILWQYNTGLRIECSLSVEWSMLGPRWLEVPARLVKGRKRGVKIWINEAARAAVARVRTGSPRILSYPYQAKSFHAQRRAVVARIDGEHSERFKTHNLRRSLLTWLARHNPLVAKLQAGHSMGGDVLGKFYVNPSVVERLMSRVPQPVEAADDRQKRLPGF